MLIGSVCTILGPDHRAPARYSFWGYSRGQVAKLEPRVSPGDHASSPGAAGAFAFPHNLSRLSASQVRRDFSCGEFLLWGRAAPIPPAPLSPSIPDRTRGVETRTGGAPGMFYPVSQAVGDRRLRQICPASARGASPAAPDPLRCLAISGSSGSPRPPD